MTDPSKSSGTQSQSGTHPMGADQAKAYVPPQVLKSKPKGQVHGAKVEIKAGVDPRRAKTEVGLGIPPQAVAAAKAAAAQGVPARRRPETAPALQTPPEVLPFKKSLTPPGGVSVDGALPFKPAAAGAPAPSNGVEYPSGPKSPPLKLMSPGELLPLSAPFGGAAAAHGNGAAAPAAPAAVAAPAVAAPQAAPDVSATPPPVVVDTAEAPAAPADAAPGGEPAARSPWGSSPSIPDESSGEEDEKKEGDPSLPPADSPWSSTHSVDHEVLPSSAMLSPSAGPSEPAPAPVAAEEPKRSSAGMTIGLALAALALVGALAYFIFAKDRGSSDPAEVKVGTEQKDYKAEPVPSTKPTASAVVAPKPAYKPRPKPAVTAKPVAPRPRPKPVDIYEDF